jgi:uncharacterized membrane protein YgdD (TMEM256/DUF423 family)
MPENVRGSGRGLICLAAVCGFVGVGLGALGGHGLESRLEEAGRIDAWQTGTRYLLIHAVACLSVALAVDRGRIRRVAGILFGVGALVFGCSLYLLCLTGITAFGAVTPVGGLLLLAGWLTLVIPPRSRVNP